MKTTKVAHLLSSHLAVIMAGYGVKHIAAAGWSGGCGYDGASA